MSENRQLATFLAKFNPEVAAVAKDALARMRKYLPGAFELVYDNYNALVIAFGPSDRTSQVVFSIALYPRWVNLFFARGSQLADPDRLLKGSGTWVRSIRLTAASDLDNPKVRKLIDAALDEADWTPAASNAGRLIIKSVSAKQRARRPKPDA
jgi:hypothetical protein